MHVCLRSCSIPSMVCGGELRALIVAGRCVSAVRMSSTRCRLFASAGCMTPTSVLFHATGVLPRPHLTLVLSCNHRGRSLKSFYPTAVDTYDRAAGLCAIIWLAQRAFRAIIPSDSGEHRHPFVPNRDFWDDIHRQLSKVAYVMAERLHTDSYSLGEKPSDVAGCPWCSLCTRAGSCRTNGHVVQHPRARTAAAGPCPTPSLREIAPAFASAATFTSCGPKGPGLTGMAASICTTGAPCRNAQISRPASSVRPPSICASTTHPLTSCRTHR